MFKLIRFCCFCIVSIALFNYIASASSLVLVSAEENVTADETVTELKSHVIINLPLTETSKEYKVGITIESSVEGHEISFCDINSCNPPGVFVSPLAFALTPGQTTTNSDIYIQVIPNGIKGKDVIKLKVFYTMDTKDFVEYTATFNFGTSAIEDEIAALGISLSQPMPNPVAENLNLNYSLPNDNSVFSLNIYDINGNIVASQVLNNTSNNIQIPVSSLATGNYVYSLISNNKTYISRRLIIVR